MATPEEFAGQLRELETCWTTVRKAHGDVSDAAHPARQALLECYGGAVYRYLHGAIRNPEAVSELWQEFALKMLRGDFHRVDPDRGRFRDYIRSVLMNMIRKHFRAQQQRPQPLIGECDVVADGTALPSFEDWLREEVLTRTWGRLEQSQPRYHAVLKLRTENSGLSSSELAERLTETTGTTWKADQVRKTIERARTTFVDLMLAEVSSSYRCTDDDDLWQTLDGLDLLKYCRNALERRNAAV
jgi:RNA polymerase sigma-70 factor (ECF subfamily)